MKLVKDKNNVQRSDNTQVEQEFQIDSTPEAFKILFDGLYSDKIMATCREIICNAMDESPDRVPDITLPGGGGPLVFKVRDYGTGLDDDDVMTLYTTVFRSTKKHANDKIGGFGLGSKAPFAYTDGFTVTSCYDEGGTVMRRVYSMFVDETGRPRVTKMHEEETDELPGLEVSVPVRLEDANSFAIATQKVLKHFPEDRTPDLGHRMVPRPDYVGHWGAFAVAVKSRGYYTRSPGSVVVMGNIQYPLELSDEFMVTAENAGYDKKMLRKVYGLGVTLFMEIGSVGLAPSREALSYTKATIATLCTAMENVATTFQTEMQAVMDAAPDNKWDRAKALYEFLDENECHKDLYTGYGFNGVFNTHAAMYSGVSLPGPVEMLYPTVNCGRKLVIKKEGLRKLGVCNAEGMTLAFVLMDGLTKETRVRSWARQQHEANNATRVILFESRGYAEAVMNLIDQSESQLRLASELPVQVVPRAKRNSTNTNEGLRRFLDRYVHNDSRYSNGPTHFWHSLESAAEFDFAEGGYYVPISRGNIMKQVVVGSETTVHHIHPHKVGTLLEALKMTNTRVLGVRAAKHRKFAKAENWINLVDHATKQAEAAITPEFQKLRGEVAASDPNIEALYTVLVQQGYGSTAISNVTLQRVWDQEHDAKAGAKKVRAVISLTNAADVSLPNAPGIPGVTWSQLQQDFPMLAPISGAWTIKQHGEDIIDYILKMS